MLVQRSLSNPLITPTPLITPPHLSPPPHHSTLTLAVFMQRWKTSATCGWKTSATHSPQRHVNQAISYTSSDVPIGVGSDRVRPASVLVSLRASSSTVGMFFCPRRRFSGVSWARRCDNGSERYLNEVYGTVSDSGVQRTARGPQSGPTAAFDRPAYHYQTSHKIIYHWLQFNIGLLSVLGSLFC